MERRRRQSNIGSIAVIIFLADRRLAIRGIITLLCCVLMNDRIFGKVLCLAFEWTTATHGLRASTGCHYAIGGLIRSQKTDLSHRGNGINRSWTNLSLRTEHTYKE